MTDLVIAPDDPRVPDVVALLRRHLAFARATTPPELVFALDGLLERSITFCSARRAGVLLGSVFMFRELAPPP